MSATSPTPEPAPPPRNRAIDDALLSLALEERAALARAALMAFEQEVSVTTVGAVLALIKGWDRRFSLAASDVSALEEAAVRAVIGSCSRARDHAKERLQQLLESPSSLVWAQLQAAAGWGGKELIPPPLLFPVPPQPPKTGGER